MKIKFLKNAELGGKTLIIPSLSTQAPSIALDHLIASNHFQKIAIITPPFLYVQPSIGYLPKSVSGQDQALGLPIEIYELGDVLILQLRSSVRFGRKKQLMQCLIQMFGEWKIKEVLMVGVLKSSSRPDLQILAIEKNIYVLQTKEKLVDKFSIASVIADPLNKLIPIQTLIDEGQEIKEVLESAGLAFHLQSLHQKKQCKFLMSEMFIFGDDISVKQQGVFLAKAVRKLFGGMKKQLCSTILQNL